MDKAGRSRAAREASRVVRSRARTFYLASLFLPRPLRRDVHVIYAYYRAVDDLVDDPPNGVREREIEARLETWRAVILGELPPASRLMAAVYSIGREYAVPPAYLTMVLDGALHDLYRRRIETTDDLIAYAVLVAGSVGMVMAHLLGTTREEALSAACDLGVAMQITNVLRDVEEDWSRGRLYLPAAELRRHGCSVDILATGAVTDELRSLLRSLAGQAHQLYRTGMAGIPYLPHRTQYSIFLAARLYSAILDKIEEREFDVLSRRVYLGPVEKALAALPIYVHHRLAQLR